MLQYVYNDIQIGCSFNSYKITFCLVFMFLLEKQGFVLCSENNNAVVVFGIKI